MSFSKRSFLRYFIQKVCDILFYRFNSPHDVVSIPVENNWIFDWIKR